MLSRRRDAYCREANAASSTTSAPPLAVARPRVCERPCFSPAGHDTQFKARRHFIPKLKYFAINGLGRLDATRIQFFAGHSHASLWVC